MRYSTGCVRDYVPNGCGGPDLPATIPEGQKFRGWYSLGGHSIVSAWENGDVWGSDFRDGGDNDAGGGSDIAQLYLFAGHGSCQNPPRSTDPDFIVVCGNFGTPNSVNIGSQSRWGNNTLNFLFVDASCPMDLVSLSNNWFPVFRGLHVATGHSGTTSADALDSDVRGDAMGSRTANLPWPLSWLFPHQSVGDAWMAVGTDDVQSGCSAVAIAAGIDRNDAINRRHNEFTTGGWGDPTPNWFAWRWRTA